MKTDETEDKKTFPDYLGFGLIDPSSIKETENKSGAKYYQNGDLVYEVAIENGRWSITEYFNGKPNFISFGKNLKYAFLHHCYAVFEYPHPRIDKISEYVAAQGNNIYMEIHSAGQPAYFLPAGLIYIMYIPLRTNTDRNVLLAKANELLPNFGIQLLGFEDALLVKRQTDGKVFSRDIVLFSFSSFLAVLDKAADFTKSLDILGKEKEDRALFLNCTSLSSGVFPIYLGDCARGYTHYTIFRKNERIIDVNELIRPFGRGCEKLVISKTQ